MQKILIEKLEAKMNQESDTKIRFSAGNCQNTVAEMQTRTRAYYISYK